MKYDFDEIIDRRGTQSSKWDNVGARVGNAKALPMWVADMDFACPKPIVNAVVERAQHPIYGYTFIDDEFKKSAVSWISRRHRWKIQEDWIVYLPNVVSLFPLMIQEYTDPGDGVIIQCPVYHPFIRSVKNNERKVVSNSLVYMDGRYEMNFSDLEEKAGDPNTKLMILCNPHNPVGRVWSREELLRAGDICRRNNVVMISDEIHSDLVYPGQKHIPLASLSEEMASDTVTAYAPSKTFNLPGLRCAFAVVPNAEIRSRLESRITKNNISMPNTFSTIAMVTAYSQCEEYVGELVGYLANNVAYLDGFLKSKMPKIKLIKPEATYLMWLDCRELGMTADRLADFFINTCLVAINRGDMFGSEGAGFVRLNIGCPRETLKKGLNQIWNEYVKL